MIIAKPIGGLGNQMFAYAAAYAVARRHSQPLVIDTSNFDSYKTWRYQLGMLHIPQDIVVPTKSQRLVPVRLRRLFRMHPRDIAYYREPHFHYDDEVEGLVGPVELNGYFQSWRYLKGVEQDLVRLFQPIESLSTTALHYMNVIERQSCAVSLHVRRGDYLSKDSAKVHGVLGIEHYRRAVALIRAFHPSASFFIFSDEPDWVERELLSGLDATVVRGQDGRPWEDMHLMARCHHNIIANSSFSWWAAWLNNNPRKHVIAPRQWFSPPALRVNNTCDLYPPEWIIL